MSDEESADETCPECGTPLAPDAPLGLCPGCLVGGWSDDDFEKDPTGSEKETIAGYEIVRQLGEGGFAVVHEAEQRVPVRRTVALKVLRSEVVSPQIVARFEAERQALALMDHPNIASIFDAGETEDGIPFVAMERIEGVPITEFCRGHDLSREQRIEILKQVCEAVQHAHLKGIIHRDLKPSNILVTEIDGRPTPKVIDFGIARALDVSLTDRTLFTEWHQLVGTPSYMSPEQASLDARPIDGRSDIYSLGVLIFEVMAGTQPFAMESDGGGETPVLEVLRRVREEEAPRLSSRDPSLRGDLDWVVRRALAKEPAERYDSAGSLARELDRILHHLPVHAGPPSTVYLARKFVRRHRVLVTAAAISVAALVTGAIVSTVQFLRATSLSRDLQASEVELRHSFRNADYRMALQLAERRRTADSIAFFCRALRTDPGHHASASCLLATLAHHQFTKVIRAPVPYPEGVKQCRVPLVFEAGSSLVALASGGEEEEAERLLVWRGGNREPESISLDFAESVIFMEALSEEGRFVLADSARWEVRSIVDPGEAQFSGNSGSTFTAFAVDAPTRTFVAGEDDGRLRSWNLDTGEKVGELAAEAGAITALGIGRDGDFVGYGTVTGKIGLWGARFGFHTGAIARHRDAVVALTLPASGTVFASGDRGGVVHLNRGRNLFHAAGPLYHSGAIRSLQISAQHQRLISGAADGYARIWDLTSGDLAAPARYRQGSLEFLSLSHDPGKVITGGSDGSVRIVEVETGSGEALAGAGRSSAFSISLDRRFFVAASDARRQIALFDLSRAPALLVRNLDGETPELAAACERVSVERVSASQLRVVRNEVTLATIRENAPITGFALDEGGRRLAVLLGTNRLQVFDPENGDPLTSEIRLAREVGGLRFPPDADDCILLEISGEPPSTLSLPPPDPSLPPWFLDFAERMGSKRLNAAGNLETLTSDTLFDAAAVIPGTETTPLAIAYARWLTAASEVRNVAPGRGATISEYVDRLVESGQRDWIREALRLDPGNERAIEFLRRQAVERRRQP